MKLADRRRPRRGRRRLPSPPTPTWALAPWILLGSACAPQLAPLPPPTLVALGPRDTGALDINLAAGASTNTYVNGVLQFEPYITPRTSVTIGATGASDFTETHGILRLGARHRFGEHLALGGALGPAYSRHTGSPPETGLGEIRRSWWGTYMDLELAAGFAVPLGLSFARRLGPFVSVGFDTWAGARFMFVRGDVSPSPSFSRNPLVTPEFGGTFSIAFHAPPPKKPKPRVLIDL